MEPAKSPVNRARYARNVVLAQQIVERPAVRFTQPDLPVRTLWYALYYAEPRSMQVSFRRRDNGGEVRSPLQEFSPAKASAFVA